MKRKSEEKTLLVVNPGSSSMKFALYRDQDELVSFYYETMGGRTDSVMCTVEWTNGRRKSKFECSSLDAAFDEMRVILATEGLVNEHSQLDAILVRLVATGQFFAESRFVDDEVMENLRQVEGVNILHVPPAIKAICDAKAAFPEVPIIVMSDSEALASSSRRDYVYAIDRRASEIVGVPLKRYGAHGNSHGYIIRRMKELELPEALGRVIVCHLGSGCSITAFGHGQPMYHSMGLTPLEGLMSSTRTGSIDPTIGAVLGEKLGAAEAIRLMNKESGLLGAGSKDMRDIIELVDMREPRAVEYFTAFVEGVAGTIGNFAIRMKEVDAIVFTATIGERSAYVREAIVGHLGQLGFALGRNSANLDLSKGYANIASDNSKSLYVIPTDEAAYMIMRAKEMIR